MTTEHVPLTFLLKNQPSSFKRPFISFFYISLVEVAGIEPASFTNTAKASTCVVSHECPKQRHRDLRCLVSCEKLRQTHATSFAIPANRRFIPSGHRYKTQNCTIRQFVLIFLRSQQCGTQFLALPIQSATTQANNIAVFTYFSDGLITKPTVIFDMQPSCYLQNRIRNTPCQRTLPLRIRKNVVSSSENREYMCFRCPAPAFRIQNGAKHTHLFFINPFHTCETAGNFASGTSRIHQHFVDGIMFVQNHCISRPNRFGRNIRHIAGNQSHRNAPDNGSGVTIGAFPKTHRSAVA